jgi:hypothetical protein
MNTAVSGILGSSAVGSIACASDALQCGLRSYLAIVATALGVGLESCTLDIDTPVSAYLAVDQ